MNALTETISTLDGVTSGVYIIATASGSEHLVDLNSMTYTRLGQEGDPTPLDLGSHTFGGFYEQGENFDRTRLRGDGKSFTLLSIRCTVDASAVIVINGVNTDEGIPTIRQTTAVTSIDQIAL